MSDIPVVGGIIGFVDTLQFIDSMTGHLGWPIATVVLGLVFRRSLGGLLGRVRRLRWREAEADLEQVAVAQSAAEEAVSEADKQLPADTDEGRRESRQHIERLMRVGFTWGFHTGRMAETSSVPKFDIVWEDGEPHLEFGPEVLADQIPFMVMQKRLEKLLLRLAPDRADEILRSTKAD